MIIILNNISKGARIIDISINLDLSFNSVVSGDKGNNTL